METCRRRARGPGHSVLLQEQDNSFQGVWQNMPTIEAIKYVNPDLVAAGRRAGLIVLYLRRRSTMMFLKPRHVRA